jgi:hypothetical protein
MSSTPEPGRSQTLHLPQVTGQGLQLIFRHSYYCLPTIVGSRTSFFEEFLSSKSQNGLEFMLAELILSVLVLFIPFHAMNTRCSNKRFPFACLSSRISSTVSRVCNRDTLTSFVSPMRCARDSARKSFYGFQSESNLKPYRPWQDQCLGLLPWLKG